MAAGYSGTPTAKKLGVKPGIDLVVLGAPGDYGTLVDGLPDDLVPRSALGRSADIVHVFVTKAAVLERRIGDLRQAIFPDGAIWVSWPKKASKMPTDVTEDVIRRIALANGLVDIKVCAIDAIWSGLKLVVPVAQRAKTSLRKSAASGRTSSRPGRA